MRVLEPKMNLLGNALIISFWIRVAKTNIYLLSMSRTVILMRG